MITFTIYTRFYWIEIHFKLVFMNQSSVRTFWMDWKPHFDENFSNSVLFWINAPLRVLSEIRHTQNISNNLCRYIMQQFWLSISQCRETQLNFKGAVLGRGLSQCVKHNEFNFPDPKWSYLHNLQSKFPQLGSLKVWKFLGIFIGFCICSRNVE